MSGRLPVPGPPDSRLSLNGRIHLCDFAVLYSPNGATRGVCDLAERVKGAIEIKALERNGYQPIQAGTVDGEFAYGTLAYNVFVVTGASHFYLPLRSCSIMPWPVGRKADREPECHAQDPGSIAPLRTLNFLLISASLFLIIVT